MIAIASNRPASSHYRWVICALLFWVTTANYIDRSVFSNLAPDLEKVIPGWTQERYYDMTVAFTAAYAISQMLAGRLMDVIGLRWGFALACGFWGLAAMSHALVSSVAGFFIVRILLALGEGGNFPAAIKTVAEWFPKRERALATGLLTPARTSAVFLSLLAFRPSSPCAALFTSAAMCSAGAAHF